MEYHAGLEGVIAAETALSLIDGEKGELLFRGQSAGEIARNRTFEEAAYFLWYGEFPNDNELVDFQTKFVHKRKIPSYVKAVIDECPIDMGAMEALRTAISALGVNASWPPTIEQAVQLTAVTPTILAYRYRKQQGMPCIPPRDDLSHVANYMYMLTGEEPKASHIHALTSYLVITMEHGLNASTFTARVIASTQSDLYSAVTGAIGAMKGPLHGGAPTGVIDMLNEIGTRGNAEPWLRRTIENGNRVMGFGHREYKTADPRSKAIRQVADSLIGDDEWLDLAHYVEKTAVRLLEEYKPGRQLFTNVDFYAAAILRAVSLPDELSTPTFTASRLVGWTAHVLEQSENNRIFRPKAKYIGL